MRASFSSLSSFDTCATDGEEALFEQDENDDLPLEKTPPFLFRPSKGYGTRCSSVVRCHQNERWEFIERRYNEKGEIVGETKIDTHSARM